MTEASPVKRSDAEKPRIFSESDLGLTGPEDVMYQRLTPEGVLVGREPGLSGDALRRMYELLVFGRHFDEKCTNLSTLREIGTYAPCKGQEGAQVGFVTALSRSDWYVPMYRDTAGMISFGLPGVNLLQYWGGDERGMKIPEGLNMIPLAVPVSTQIPHAVGTALAKRLQKEDVVVLVSTGDGGTSKGDFHEGLNFAGVYDLPVIFVVENNHWAISVRRERQTASATLAQKALAYGFEGMVVDGNDALASYEATKFAVDRARRGGGPTLLEFNTYRMGPHTTAELVSNKLKAQDEVEAWEKKSPLLRFERYLRSRGLLDDDFKQTALLKAQSLTDEAVRAFRALSPVDPREMFRYMFSLPPQSLLDEMAEAFGTSAGFEPFRPGPEPTISGGKPGVNIRNAVNMALRQEMDRNGRIVVFGEDVGKNGGVFQVTKGLQDEFGPDRVFDTPLAELGIAGLYVGLAIGGMVPVGEFQFEGFSLPAFDQIFGHVARMRNRTRGRFKMGGVIRFPYGGGVKAPEHHSDSPEAYFAHTPGLTVVIPSNAFEAKGLLASALRGEDPVIFMEPKRLYDSPKMDVPEEEYTVPIGKARVVREGGDLTLVSYGAMMVPTLQAADSLRAENSISADVIDLRTISPLDFDTVLGSVAKTGRLVIVHEAPKSLGVGAEIAAVVADRAIDHLRAPIKRVTGFDTVVPLAKLEDQYLPSKDRIVKAALGLTTY
ncbi:MAG TPA: thiamine pyrophosphate-dependent enzyme [Nitrososphaerales archaeon]|nr:thiamine pyrophosphate-dependent enzyme [Nitrososphaerales archaeon]